MGDVRYVRALAQLRVVKCGRIPQCVVESRSEDGWKCYHHLPVRSSKYGVIVCGSSGTFAARPPVTATYDLRSPSASGGSMRPRLGRAGFAVRTRSFRRDRVRPSAGSGGWSLHRNVAARPGRYRNDGRTSSTPGPGPRCRSSGESRRERLLPDRPTSRLS